MEITDTQAKKVLDTVDAGLCKGLGVANPGEMCVEAAVCFGLGLPHSDNPSCVMAALKAYKIRLNDSDWSSNEARARGMRKLALAQLGSLGMDDIDFAKRMAEATIRKVLPIALRAIGLDAEAVKCETDGTARAAYAAARAAYAAARAEYAARAAEYAARAAEYAEYAARAAANGDLPLIASADACLQVLRDMNAPGIKWVDMFC